VTIGGQPATILYAGDAPTLATGVFQINVRIRSLHLGAFVVTNPSVRFDEGPSAEEMKNRNENATRFNVHLSKRHIRRTRVLRY
jgi:hypothetical protein